MFNLDFEKIGNLATLVKAGMSLQDIKAYAEVIETAPDLPKDAALEDVKAAAEKTSVEELPKTEDKKEVDAIETLKNLVKED